MVVVGGAPNHLRLLFCKIVYFPRMLKYMIFSNVLVFKSLLIDSMVSKIETFSPQFLSMGESNSRKKIYMLPTFQKWTICKGLYQKKWLTISTRETTPETYVQTIIRWSLLWMLFKSIKKLYVIDIFIDQSATFWRFRKKFSGWSCVWILPGILV